jgi:hypothetical protein
MAPTSGVMRVFATKPFMRFVRRFGITESELLGAVHDSFDADLGGGVFKFRLPRKGEGSTGGARIIVAMKTGQRIVMMFGFEKKDLANIKIDELKAFRKAARIYLGYSEEEMPNIAREKSLAEIAKPKGAVDKHAKNL